MTVPPIVARRVLPAPQREALDLMLRALFILDCAGELGPGAALSGAYQAAVTIAQGKALPLTFHG
jgi:hypothetical protein